MKAYIEKNEISLSDEISRAISELENLDFSVEPIETEKRRALLSKKINDEVSNLLKKS